MVDGYATVHCLGTEIYLTFFISHHSRLLSQLEFYPMSPGFCPGPPSISGVPVRWNVS